MVRRLSRKTGALVLCLALILTFLPVQASAATMYNWTFNVTPADAAVSVVKVAGGVETKTEPLEEGGKVYSLESSGSYKYTISCEGYESATGSIVPMAEDTVTASLVFLIEDADDFKQYVELVKTVPTQTAKLTADIDLTASDEFLGTTKETAFKGTLDGNGHKITVNLDGGLDIDQKPETTVVAFIPYADGATIKNLTVAGSVKNGQYTAGIVGTALDNGVVIENCVNNAEITGVDQCSDSNVRTGGIMADASAFANSKTRTGAVVIKNCVNNGAITAGSGLIGGILAISGCADTVVSNCYNTGSVTHKLKSGENHTGGIAGYASYTIENCYNTGVITGPYTGAIAGSVSSDHAKNCYYLEGSCSYASNKEASFTGITKLTSEELKDAAWMLGNAFRADETPEKNSGYPILAFQASETKYVLKFETNEGAAVVLKDANAAEVTAEHDRYVVADGTYSYEITKTGYEPKSGTLTINGSDYDQLVTLYEIPTLNNEGWYELSKPEHILWLNQMLTEDFSLQTPTCLASYQVKLMNDIDMAETEFNGFAFNSQKYSGFGGKFDGCGYTINIALSGYSNDISKSAQTSYLSLFGMVANGTSIKNLNVSGSVNGASNTAALIGYASKSFELENCRNFAEVTGTGDCCGGLVAQIKYTKATAGSCSIKNCVNYGNTSATGKQVGGLVGYYTNFYDNSSVSGCINYGTIKSTNSNDRVGGIFGQIDISAIASLSNLANYGKVIGTTSVGGVVGYLNNSKKPTFNNIINAGGIEHTTGTFQTGVYGQLVGKFAKTTKTYMVTLNNCYYLNNDTPVVSTAATAGTAYTNTSLYSKSADDMKTAATASSLGNAFYGVDGSYPILAAMADDTKYDVNFNITFSRKADETEDYTIELKDCFGNTIAAESGKYSVLPGIYSYTVSADEFVTVEGKLTVSSAAATVSCILLKDYTISFKLAQPGAALVLKDKDGNVLQPGEDGKYHVVDGDYPYTVTCEGYQTATGSVHVLSGSRIITVELVKEFTGEEIQIATAQDFVDFLCAVKADTTNHYKGKTAVFTADIDLEAYTLPEYVRFSGTLDGQGHKIYNLTSVIFQALNYGGTIKNLGVESGEVTATFSTSVAAFVLANYGTISHCYNKANVTGNFAAGIAIENHCNINDAEGISEIAVIEYCSNEGNITAVTNPSEENTETSGRVAAIVVGLDSRAVVNNCFNTGKITGKYTALVCVSNPAGIIKNCYNAGTYETTSTTAGGASSILGIASVGVNDSPVKVTNCYGQSELPLIFSGAKADVSNKRMSLAEMKNPAFVEKLNAEQSPAPWTVNVSGGYPLLLAENTVITEKERLQNIIYTAAWLKDNGVFDGAEGNYPAEQKQLLTDAVSAAQAVYDNEQSKETDYTAAAAKLQKAYDDCVDTVKVTVSSVKITSKNPGVRAKGTGGQAAATVSAKPDVEASYEVIWTASENITIDASTGAWVSTGTGDAWIKATSYYDDSKYDIQNFTLYQASDDTLVVHFTELTLESAIDKAAGSDASKYTKLILTTDNTSILTIDKDQREGRNNRLNALKIHLLTAKYKNIVDVDLSGAVVEDGLWSSAFASYTTLQRLVLPENTISIDAQAFSGCTSLEEIVLPEGLESIGEKAFGSCAQLTNIVIPSTVTSIGDDFLANTNAADGVVEFKSETPFNAAQQAITLSKKLTGVTKVIVPTSAIASYKAAGWGPYLGLAYKLTFTTNAAIFEVTLKDENGKLAEPYASNTFDVADGTYTYAITADGYIEVSGTVIVSGGNTEKNVTLESNEYKLGQGSISNHMTLPEDIVVVKKTSTQFVNRINSVVYANEDSSFTIDFHNPGIGNLSAEDFIANIKIYSDEALTQLVASSESGLTNVTITSPAAYPFEGDGHSTASFTFTVAANTLEADKTYYMVMSKDLTVTNHSATKLGWDIVFVFDTETKLTSYSGQACKNLSGNTILMTTPDAASILVKSAEADKSAYFNIINKVYDPSQTISFAFDFTGGGTGQISNNYTTWISPNIKVYSDEACTQVAAENGNGIENISVQNAVTSGKNISFSISAGKLENGKTYYLVLGPDMKNKNNTTGTTYTFMFSTKDMQSAPQLSGETDGKVGNDAVISFVNNTAWRKAITSVTVDGVEVAADKYTRPEGKITIDASLFTELKSYKVVVKAEGYQDAEATVTKSAYTYSVQTVGSYKFVMVNPGAEGITNVSTSANLILNRIEGSLEKENKIVFEFDLNGPGCGNNFKLDVAGKAVKIYADAELTQLVAEYNGTDGVLDGHITVSASTEGLSKKMTVELPADTLERNKTYYFVITKDFKGQASKDASGCDIVFEFNTNESLTQYNKVQGNSANIYMTYPDAVNIGVKAGTENSETIINVIKTKIDVNGSVSFLFDAGGSGANHIGEQGCGDVYAWPNVKIYSDKACTQLVASYAGGQLSFGNVTEPVYTTNGKKNVTLTVAENVLEADKEYYLVFDAAFATNSTNKNLGVNVVFRFETFTSKLPDAPVITAEPEVFIGDDVNVSFTDDSAWRAAVTQVLLDGTVVEQALYEFGEGTLVIDGSLFTEAKSYTVTINAAGYEDAVFNQDIAVETFAISINTNPAGAKAAVYDAEGNAMTAVSGVYTLSAGTYYYRVSADNYVSRKGSFVVSKNETIKVALDACTAHEYGDWYTEVEAECEQAGVRAHVCKICNYVEKETIQALQHSFGEYVITVEPTISSKGREESTCAVCGAKKSREINPSFKDETTGITFETSEGAFPEGTTIVNKTVSVKDSAEKESIEKAMSGVEGEYVVFEITATKDGKGVEPSAAVTVTINVPEGIKNPAIYYIHDGVREAVECVVKDGCISAVLTHFSLYVIAEKTETPEPEQSLSPLVYVIAAIVIAAIICLIIISKKKKA